MGKGSEIDLEAVRERLLARRAELDALAAATADSRQPVELDQSTVGRLSRMDALQMREMALETARRRDNELRRIAAALKRIDADEYGYCIRCGGNIAARRLALDPTVPLCIDCAGATSP